MVARRTFKSVVGGFWHVVYCLGLQECSTCHGVPEYGARPGISANDPFEVNLKTFVSGPLVASAKVKALYADRGGFPEPLGNQWAETLA